MSTWRDKYKAILRETFSGRFMRIGLGRTLGKSEAIQDTREKTMPQTFATPYGVPLATCSKAQAHARSYRIGANGLVGLLGLSGFRAPGQYPEEAYYRKLKAIIGPRGKVTLPRGLGRRRQKRMLQSAWLDRGDGVREWTWLPAAGMAVDITGQLVIVDVARNNAWFNRRASGQA